MGIPETGPIRGLGPSRHLFGAEPFRAEIQELRATIEAAPLGIAQFDPNGHLLLVNAQLCALLGYSRQDLLERTYQEVSHPRDAADSDALNRQLLSGATRSYRHEMRFVRADGSLIWARVTVSLVRGESERPAYFVAFVEDVSEARGHEAARRQAEARLRIALEASSTGTFRWDIRSGSVEWDENLNRLFGLAPGRRVHTVQEFLGLVAPADRGRVARAIRRSLRTGADLAAEFRVALSDGRVRWFLDRGRTLRDRDGAPLEMTGACTDITELKRAEQAVRESEAWFRGLVDASPLGILITGLDGDPVFYNPRAEELHGLHQSEAAGEGWLSAIHPEDRDRVAASWYRAARTRVPWTDTYRFRHPDGEVVWVIGRTAPLEVDGSYVGHVGTLEDVTAIKAAEEAVRASELELARLLARERSARARAELATQRRDEVLGVVAHDLRNPVHTILASASLLADGIVDAEEEKRQLGVIERSARSMETLIQDLLAISHMESGIFAIQRAGVDVRRLLPQAMELVEHHARRKGIQLECSVASGVGRITGDADRLSQLLSNLLGNAIKFTPRGGMVRVEAEDSDRGVHIRVQDTGPGIAPEDLPRIFDRFWQAGSKNRAGAGLGLAISKAIVEAHGGRLHVDSTVGQGTTFSFNLPA